MALGYWHFLPSMYIMTKQLSNAKPTRKRQKLNAQKLCVNAVAMPATAPIMLVPTRAGMRPKRSAIQPKIKPPKMAPTKKIACAVLGSADCSQTQFNWRKKNVLFQNFKIILLKKKFVSKNGGIADRNWPEIWELKKMYSF